MNATKAEIERSLVFWRGAARFEREHALLESDPRKAAQRRHLADLWDEQADYLERGTARRERILAAAAQVAEDVAPTLEGQPECDQ